MRLFTGFIIAHAPGYKGDTPMHLNGLKASETCSGWLLTVFGISNKFLISLS